MGQDAKLTRAVRLRSQAAGEWLVAQAGPEGKRSRKSGAFRGQFAVQSAALPDFRELMTAVDFESSEEQVLLISAEDPATLERMQRFFSLLEDRLNNSDEAEMLRLIEVAMPTLSDRPPAEAVDQARRNAQARDEFLHRYEVLEAEDVHIMYGSRAKNKAALAARWRTEGKVFAFEHAGRLVYPAFQFDAQGRPKPMVADVLAALGEGVGPWQIALWFASANGWLDGTSPLTLLNKEPARVIDAAQAISEPVTH